MVSFTVRLPAMNSGQVFLMHAATIAEERYARGISVANYITNDGGTQVLAIGAPGSIARAEVEHPLKIAAIDEMYCQAADRDEAVLFLKESGINSEMERESIMHHTCYDGGLI